MLQDIDQNNIEIFANTNDKICDIFEKEFWFTKKQSAEHYEQNHKISSTFLIESDVLCLNKEGYHYESKKREDFPQMRDFLYENYYEKLKTSEEPEKIPIPERRGALTIGCICGHGRDHKGCLI